MTQPSRYFNLLGLLHARCFSTDLRATQLTEHVLCEHILCKQILSHATRTPPPSRTLPHAALPSYLSHTCSTLTLPSP